MVAMLSQPDEISVLASGINWAWPQALRDIFQPRGVNLLMVRRVDEFADIMKKKRIHTAIVDMDCEKSNALTTIKIIRMDFPLLPCILLTKTAGKSLLGKALELDIFSVIDKPVDMTVLQGQLNKLFVKKYNNNIFRIADAELKFAGNSD